MNSNSGSGRTGTFILGLVAGIVAVVVAGGLYLSGIFGGAPEPIAPEVVDATEPTPDATEPAESLAEETSEPFTPSAKETPTETVQAEAEKEEVAAPTVAALVLDQTFLEPDGTAQLSGKGEPGAEVKVLLDTEVIQSFFIDDDGWFSQFVTIPFSDAVRGLVLEMQADGKVVRSDDYLIDSLPAPPAPEDTVPSVEEPSADVAEAETTAVIKDPTVETAEADTTEVEEKSAAQESAQAESAEVVSIKQQATDQTEVMPDPQGEVEAADPQASDVSDQQVAILRSGEKGVELVQRPTAQETAPEQIALDTIGYSDSGNAELTGRAQEGSAVRLYLDNRLVADLVPAVDGQWRGEVEGVDPGIYTLRVDEVASDGTVIGRIETPFKRESADVLQAARIAEAGETSEETPPIRSVTIQRGDTLWAISRERFGKGILYVKLFEANRDSIRDPDLIYPGQIFTIPE